MLRCVRDRIVILHLIDSIVVFVTMCQGKLSVNRLSIVPLPRDIKIRYVRIYNLECR